MSFVAVGKLGGKTRRGGSTFLSQVARGQKRRSSCPTRLAKARGAPVSELVFETIVSGASSSSPLGLLFDGLIGGRSPVPKTAPSSLLDLFRSPYRYRTQSITGLLTEIIEKLSSHRHRDLERSPLTEAWEKKLENDYFFGLSRGQSRDRILTKSLIYGREFLKGKGYEFEDEKLDKPRALILELISLAQVGRRLCEHLDKLEKITKTEKARKTRVKALVELGAIIEMMIDKGSMWERIVTEEGERSFWDKYTTVDEIKAAIADGKKDLALAKLFGPEQERDYRGMDLSGVGGVPISSGIIDYKTISTLDGGGWRGLIGRRLERWTRDGGILDLAGRDLSGADLRYAEVPNLNLRGSILTGAYFERADLREADLRDAKLDGADLYLTFLWDANLQNASLNGVKTEHVLLGGANIQGASFKDADLKNALLKEADLRGADFSRASLKGARFHSANLKGTNLEGADLTGAVIDLKALKTISEGPWRGPITISERINAWRKRGGKLDFEGEELKDVDFRGADLKGANLVKANLTGAILDRADLKGTLIDYESLLNLNTGEWQGDITIIERINRWRARGGKLYSHSSEFNGLDLRGADLSDSDLSSSSFEGANLQGANLRGTLLHEVNLKGVNLKYANLQDAEITFDSLESLDTGPWAENLTVVNRINAWRNRGGKIRIKKLPEGTDLRGADLRKTYFECSYLRSVNLSDVDLREAKFYGVHFIDTDLAGANLEGTIFEGSEIDYDTLMILDTGDWKKDMTFLERVNTWAARGGKVEFYGRDFSEKDLQGINFKDASLIEAKFRYASLRGANFSRAVLDRANLASADLRGAEFKGAYLRKTSLYGADLRGANFDGADLVGHNLGDRTYIENAVIDEKALDTINRGEWGWLSLDEKKKKWKEGGGIIKELDMG